MQSEHESQRGSVVALVTAMVVIFISINIEKVGIIVIISVAQYLHEKFVHMSKLGSHMLPSDFCFYAVSKLIQLAVIIVSSPDLVALKSLFPLGFPVATLIAIDTSIT